MSFSCIKVNGTSYHVKDSTARTDIASLKTRVSTVESDTSSLKTRVTTLESTSGSGGGVSTSELISTILTGAQGYGDKIVTKDLANGLIKFQSGLIVQWGRLTKSALNSTVNFKESFTNTTSWAFVTNEEMEHDNLPYRQGWIRTVNTNSSGKVTGVVIRNGNYASNCYHRWIAIGY